MTSNRFAHAALACALAMISSAPAGALPVGITMETVAVGDAGNAPDSAGLGGNGTVAYNYRIGVHEVTNAQYAEFLNSVAATDAHSLYSENMALSGRGGILRSGLAGSFNYTVKPNFDDKPVVFVTFWDAVRFANWLENGQPAGVQDAGTTEDGAYALNGVTNPGPLTVSRNVGATWFIPTEAEWYKAAYYQPSAAGGDADDYWTYAYRGDAPPIIAAADGAGNVANPGAGVANTGRGADWNGQDGNVTTVGGAGPLSMSYYGTFDQSGNAWEWTENAVRGFAGGNVRGGGWESAPVFLEALREFGQDPHVENDGIGFRVAAVAIPEPASIALLAASGAIMLAGAVRRRASERQGLRDGSE